MDAPTSLKGSTMKTKLTMETINCEPDWQQMFGHAIRIVQCEIAHDSGQEFVVEMLECGQRYRAEDEKRKLQNKEEA